MFAKCSSITEFPEIKKWNLIGSGNTIIKASEFGIAMQCLIIFFIRLYLK